MTSPTPQITDYVRRIQDDLLSQFHHDPVINDLMEVIGLEIQRCEDLLYDVATKTLLDNAVGDILDWLGGIVRVQRLGRTDSDYRKIIGVAIAANDSDGGAEQITWIASQLVGATVQYVQEGVARFRLDYESDDTMSDELTEEALELIGRAVPAGVAWRLQAGEALAINTGRYDADTYGEGRYGAIIGGEP